MKNRTLIGLFIILATIYGLTQLFWKKQERRFSANLVEIDTSKVTSISLIPKGSATEIFLLRENGEWIASKGQINVKAPMGIVQTLLGMLPSIQTNQIVAKTPAHWHTYGVNENQGTHIRVYQGKNLLTDFILGKLDSSATLQHPISYLRLADENEVYAIDGIVAMNFFYDFDAFRNRTLLNMEPFTDIAAFEAQAPDTTYQFIKKNIGWTLGNATLDSMQVENFLNGLRNLSGDTFADDFDEVQGSKFLFQTLTIKSKNNEDSLVIHCYRDTTRQLPFVIQSSQNPESFFSSDSTGIYQRIFSKLNNLKNFKSETRQSGK